MSFARTNATFPCNVQNISFLLLRSMYGTLKTRKSVLKKLFVKLIRYSEEGFKNARSAPFKQVPSLKIAVEGKRYLSPEKKDVFVRFANNRPSRSARQDGRPAPPVSNPLFGHAPQHTQFDEPVPIRPGYEERPPPPKNYNLPPPPPPDPLMAALDRVKTTPSNSAQNNQQQNQNGGGSPRKSLPSYINGTTTKTAFKQPAADAFRKVFHFYDLFKKSETFCSNALFHSIVLDCKNAVRSL